MFKKIFQFKLIFIVIVIILLIFFYSTKLLLPLENFLKIFFLPFQSKTYQIANKIHEKTVFSKETIEENKKLKKEIQKLIVEKSQIEELFQENEALRKELNFIKKNNIPFIITQIIGETNNLGFQTLIINKGEADGLREGLPVIMQGFLIGKIIKVDKYTAQILPIIESHSLVAATIQNFSKTSGLVKGEYNLSLIMELIPKDIKIKVGDLVITSGLEENIPRGLIIGQVEKIISQPEELYQKAQINSSISFKNLNILTILLPLNKK
ncbi:rod shape-determining protein MreC [Candidatus Kuenenbacteria bacterium HGW-Kuenenbacteria-1]|uniref:Cell shape-determining protein MreC n=1 Tax=Candidatus Kuenenbacteria bacterium HGW-Kuenenbacteria-1 TaxID=2013812 RepID=A0A2N1UMY2_9BACT|nr:MAG: rod shape-determining protein MreC [Candidatus Kuenenbacteria bacterium HGW-Kuenenbacteria-1]